MKKEKRFGGRSLFLPSNLMSFEHMHSLLKSVGDKLNGEFDDAVECAEKFNRINLKNTHYSMAKHYEAIGEVDMAIKYYISSNTHQREVPRMLTAMQMIDRL